MGYPVLPHLRSVLPLSHQRAAVASEEMRVLLMLMHKGSPAPGPPLYSTSIKGKAVALLLSSLACAESVCSITAPITWD